MQFEPTLRTVNEWVENNPRPRYLFGRPRIQEERDEYNAECHAWHQKYRAVRLRVYGGPPPRGFDPIVKDTGDPRNKELETWRQNIHDRLSSQQEQASEAYNSADASASEKTSRLRAPTPRTTKNTSGETRGGRITENTEHSHSIANRGTRSQRTAPTVVQASIADHRSKPARASIVVDRPDESTAQVLQETRKTQLQEDKKRASDAVQDVDDQGLQSKSHNTKQRKTYKQERGSRRPAGRLPEFGMLPKRGKPAPPYEPPLNTRQPNSFVPRSGASSKSKSIAVKGAKPRGISNSGSGETNRPKRSKKGSED